MKRRSTADFLYPLPEGYEPEPIIGMGAAPENLPHPKRRHFPAAERAAMIAEVLSGVPAWRVALEHSVSFQHIQYLVREARKQVTP